jgi:zinc transport system ATP-binding protein
MPLVRCQDLSFAYEGQVVISGLDFRIDAGDYLCIAGENGSGKSTLVKGLLKLLPPQSGRIIWQLEPSQIGYLPQQAPAVKDFPASGYEVVMSGRLNRLGLRPFYNRRDRQLAEENLRRLDIAGLKNRCYRELSGGQQQRVLLARALNAARQMLILDEPTAGLDPPAAQSLYRLLAAINQETGMTIAMVSHDLGQAIKYARSILHLQKEQIFFGSSSEYLRSAPGRHFMEGGAP